MLKGTIVGNIGSDPQQQYSQGGQPFLRFNVEPGTHVRGTVEERLLAHSAVSDGHGDPPQPKPCLLTTYSTTTDGYGHIQVAGRTSRVHVEAYKCWVGPIPEGCEVTHKCNVRRCFEPTHLSAETTKQNAEYKVACGRQVRGEQHPKAKLTDTDVIAIQLAVLDGASMRSLARQYGVSHISIRDIVRGKNWKHLSEEYV